MKTTPHGRLGFQHWLASIVFLYFSAIGITATAQENMSCSSEVDCINIWMRLRTSLPDEFDAALAKADKVNCKAGWEKPRQVMADLHRLVQLSAELSRVGSEERAFATTAPIWIKARFRLADSALASGCLDIADENYRALLAIGDSDPVAVNRAKVGIDDVRARRERFTCSVFGRCQ
jgi:hypothetical protein